MRSRTHGLRQKLLWYIRMENWWTNDPLKEERLPVLASGVGGVKLLGVPALSHRPTQKSGPQIASVTKKLLVEWNCSTTVSGKVFDTTSANTGADSTGCISIQIEMGRELLWLACHHLDEVILNHVWDYQKMEVSKSPYIHIHIFGDFQEQVTLVLL